MLFWKKKFLMREKKALQQEQNNALKLVIAILGKLHNSSGTLKITRCFYQREIISIVFQK